jgi:hypothetical protein
MIAKLTDSTAGKVGVAVIAVVAVFVAVFAGIRANSGDKPADPKEVKDAAQKQIDVIKSNPNLPPALRDQMIAHEQGLMQGASRGAGGSAPKGSTAGG